MLGVSIITAVLPKRAGFIAEAAESVNAVKELFSRHGVGVEWLLVIDGPGELWIPEAVDHVVRLPARAGVSMSRNLALARASHAWVFPLDADDLVSAEGLWCLYDVISTDPNLSWVAGNRLLTSGEKTPHWFDSPKGWKPGGLASSWTAPFPFHPNSVLLSREAVLRAGGWPALSANEDLALVLNVSELAPGRALTPVVTLYRSWLHQSVASQDYTATKPLAFEIVLAQLNALRRSFGRTPVEPPLPGGAFGIRKA